MLEGFGTAQAPPEVLAALREIDHAADLVHLGGDEWWLGVRGPNREAQQRLKDEMAATAVAIADSASDPLVAREEGKRLQMLSYMAEGFYPIELYSTHQPDQRIVDDFRVRDFNLRNREAEAHREFREAVSLDAGEARRNSVVREWARAEAGSWHRYAFRRAVSVVVGALPWNRRSQ